MSLVNYLREMREPQMQEWLREEELRAAFDDGVECGKIGVPLLADDGSRPDLTAAFADGYAVGEMIAMGGA